MSANPTYRTTRPAEPEVSADSPRKREGEERSGGRGWGLTEQYWVMSALGTQWRGQYTAFNQTADGLNVFNLVQTICQHASLMRRQFLKLGRQYLELLGCHRDTYLIDWYGNSIGHYLTVT